MAKLDKLDKQVRLSLGASRAGRLLGLIVLGGVYFSGLAAATGEQVEDKVAFLSEKLEDASSFKVRLKAAVLLGRLSDPRAVTPLTKALRDENYVVRGAAARALGNLGLPIAEPAIESLLRLVEDEVPFVRQEAQQAIKRLAGPDSADNFIAALSSSRPAIRLAAVLVLPGIATPEARSALMMALGDEDEEVRSEAIVAVKGLGHAELEVMLRAALGRMDNYQVQATAARLAGELRVRALLDSLADLMASDAVVPVARKEAEQALREMKEQLDVSALVAQLSSADRLVQARATQLLGIHAGRPAVDALMDLLRHVDPYMRQRAVFALGDAGDPRAIPALEFLLKSEQDPRFRKLVDRALRKLRL